MKSVTLCCEGRFGVWAVRQTKKRNRGGGRPAGIGDCRENVFFLVSQGSDSSRHRYPMSEIDNLRELCVMALRRTKGLRVNRV